MNVVNEEIRVLAASDPTLVGLRGKVLLDTANTLLLNSTGKTKRVPKSGVSFQLVRSGEVLTGAELAGRLQDRLGRGGR